MSSLSIGSSGLSLFGSSGSSLAATSLAAPTIQAPSLSVAAPAAVEPIVAEVTTVKKQQNRVQKSLRSAATKMAETVANIVYPGADTKTGAAHDLVQRIHPYFLTELSNIIMDVAKIDTDSGKRVPKKHRHSGYSCYGDQIRTQLRSELDRYGASFPNYNSSDPKLHKAAVADLTRRLEATADTMHQRVALERGQFPFHAKTWKAMSDADRERWNNYAEQLRQQEGGSVRPKEKQRARQPYNLFTSDLTEALKNRSNLDPALVRLRGVYDYFEQQSLAKGLKLSKAQIQPAVWRVYLDKGLAKVYQDRAEQEKQRFQEAHPELNSSKATGGGSQRTTTVGQSLIEQLGKPPGF